MCTSDSDAPAGTHNKNNLSLGAVGVCVSSMLGMTVAHAADTVPVDTDGDGDGDVEIGRAHV